MFTTKHLRCILGNEPLSFMLPGEVFDNWTLHTKSGKKIPLNLHIMVFPDDRKNDYWNHKVLVNGTNQRNLNPGSEIYDAWIKTPKDKNHIWFKFMFDWRCLLNLDNKDLEYGVDILGNYLKNPIYYWLKYEVIGEHGLRIRTKKGSHKRHPLTPNPRFKRTYKNQPPFVHAPYPLAYVKDVVTGAVERVSINEAKHLVEKYDHYEYCSGRTWRHFLHDQKPRLVVNPNLYWSDEPNKTKDEKGNEVITNSFMPKIDPKDKIKEQSKRDQTRKQRRDWKHKKRLNDMHTHYQTIVIPPKYEKLVYLKDHKGKITKRIDLAKSKVATEKYQIRQQVFEYEYVPMTFSSKKQPEIQQFFWPDGSPKMKKIYKGDSYETVTIIEPSRTTYKTIITKQYPSVISNRRHIVKKNIKLLQKQQEDQLKINQNEKEVQS